MLQVLEYWAHLLDVEFLKLGLNGGISLQQDDAQMPCTAKQTKITAQHREEPGVREEGSDYESLSCRD